MNDKIPFTRKIQKLGNSLSVSIPEEITKFLGLEKSQELTMIVDTNKHGKKYIAMYKEE